MKKIYTLLSATLLSVMAFAQNSSLSFFTDRGEKFWILLNGVAQNAKPEANVKVDGLTEGFYRVRIVFQIDTLGEINQNVGIEGGKNDVYIIRKKNTPAAFKKTKGPNAVDPKVYDRYVLRPFSTSENGGQPAPTANQDVIVYGQGEPLNTEEVVHPINTSIQIQTSQTTTTTTTTKQKSAPANNNSGGINFNMNVDPNSGNMNINMNGTGVNVQTNQQNNSTSTTSTTTTTSTTRNQSQTPAPSPAPARTTTVIRAMNSVDFDKAVAQIKAQTFEDTKMKVAKQVLKNNYMNCSQIKTIIGLLTYEESKLDFAKAAYERCVEKNNYYLLNDAFTYSTSVDDLNEFLESK
jgi:hypothetical protein